MSGPCGGASVGSQTRSSRCSSGRSWQYLRLMPKQLHCRVQVGEYTDANTSVGASVSPQSLPVPKQPWRSVTQRLHGDLSPAVRACASPVWHAEAVWQRPPTAPLSQPASSPAGPPARAPPAAPLQPARGGGLRLLVPQFKAEAARLAPGSLPVARPAADVTRVQPPGRKAPARPAQQAGISAEHSRGDRQQQQPAAEQAQTAGVDEPAQASSHPSGRAAAEAEAPQPEQVSARHAGGKGGPEEPQQPQRSSRKRARDGQGSLTPAAADTVKPEQPSDAESDEVQGGHMHSSATATHRGTDCCCCGEACLSVGGCNHLVQDRHVNLVYNSSISCLGMSCLCQPELQVQGRHAHPWSASWHMLWSLEPCCRCRPALVRTPGSCLQFHEGDGLTDGGDALLRGFGRLCS